MMKIKKTFLLLASVAAFSLQNCKSNTTSIVDASDGSDEQSTQTSAEPETINTDEQETEPEKGTGSSEIEATDSIENVTESDSGKDTSVDTGSDSVVSSDGDTENSTDVETESDSDSGIDVDGGLVDGTDDEPTDDEPTDALDTNTSDGTDSLIVDSMDTGLCSDTSCPAHSKCSDSTGEIVCKCLSGYYKKDDLCLDIDECENYTSDCRDIHSTCTNTDGGYTCGCEPGWALKSDGFSCSDIDECETDNGGCEHVCTNTTGSYECSCHGWEVLQADGVTCEEQLTGRLAEVRTINGLGSESVSAITSFLDDSYLISGTFNGDIRFSDAPEDVWTAEENTGYYAKYTREGELLWVKTVAEDNSVAFSELSSLTDGSFIAGGAFGDGATFGSLAGQGLISRGGIDVFLAYYTVDGALSWIEQIGGEGYDHIYGISNVHQGAFAISGEMDDPSTTLGDPPGVELVSRGRSDIYAAKYSDAGKLSWAKQAGGASYSESGQDISIGADGAVWQTGYFEGLGYFGDEPRTELDAGESRNAFISKYDTNGGLEWVLQGKLVPPSEDNDDSGGMRIVMMPDNTAIVFGWFRGTLAFGDEKITQTNPEGAVIKTDGFAVKVDADGNVLWLKHLVGTNEGYVSEALLAKDNTVVVAGEFSGTMTLGDVSLVAAVGTDPLRLARDIFVGRFDADGNVLWAKSIVGTGWEDISGISVLSDNSVLVVGSYSEGAVFGAGEPLEVTPPVVEGSEIFVAHFAP